MSGILNLLIGSSGYGLNDFFTLTPGTFSDADESEVGYRNYTRTYGSVSSTALQDSTTLLGFFHYGITIGEETNYGLTLRISGFGGDPGLSYIRGIVVDGVDWGAPSSRVYSSGTCTWNWDTGVASDPFTASPPSSVYILY